MIAVAFLNGLCLMSFKMIPRPMPKVYYLWRYESFIIKMAFSSIKSLLTMEMLQIIVANGHNNLRRPLATNRIYVTIRMMWPLVTKMLLSMLWSLATTNCGGIRLQITSVTFIMLWHLVTKNCGCLWPQK